MPPEEPTSPRLKLTIAIGAYNDSRFLRGGLDAILAQTFTNYEVVISDNASTDETPQILKEYAEKDARIRILRQPENVGLINNYNFLRKQAKGEFFMWVACDDRCAPDYIQTIITGMEQDSSVVLGFTPYQFIHEDGTPFGPVRRFDFSGRNAFTRLLRYFFLYDDGMVYGIYRYQSIKDQNFPIWWWKNFNTPLNTGYAFLTYILSKGQFRVFGDKPLWFNCIKTTEHYQPFKQNKRVVQFFLFFLLRKINVACVQFNNIRRGSGSILLPVILSPVLLLRLIVDVLILIRNLIIKVTRHQTDNSSY
jgi:glycosyltransferase involved in cell wall biosynthesis